MDRNDIINANRQATQKIKQVPEGLPETLLNQPMPNGWSIAVTLGHLAFWDQKVLHTINLSAEQGKLKNFSIDEVVNDILAPVLAQIPVKNAVDFMLQTAEALDAQLAACSDDLFTEMDQANRRWVARSLHRSEHLADIEAFLKTTA